MSAPDVRERMREDWNRRAREDAKYYVAFGRRGQDDEEFFATAREVAHGLEFELKRLPPGNPRARRALEIGCGPGRLMRPMSAHFGEIHGVDVSDGMVALAREKLRAVPHAHVHRNDGATLAAFADDSFDFVYSYAVFQHIPSRDVVFEYLRESRRVLKPGGILRCQINGLPETAARYDTWSGVRISAREAARFALENDFQLLALEGASTQYLWVTLRKQPAGWAREVAARPACWTARIRRITNAHSSEPAVPNRGRFASIALWLEGLPEECDLNRLAVRIGGAEGAGFFLGPADADGLRQMNVALPPGLATGLQPLRLEWLGQSVAGGAFLRVIPPGPAVPRIIAVSDGIDLLSGTRIVTNSVKVTIEEAGDLSGFQATVDGQPVKDLDIFCTDPLPPCHEINFQLPEGAGPGRTLLAMRLGSRRFAPVEIEIADRRAHPPGA